MKKQIQTTVDDTRKKLKNGKNIFGVLCSLLLALCVVFSACGDDKDENGGGSGSGSGFKITAKVEDASEYSNVDIVEFVAHHSSMNHVLAVGDFKDGGFTIYLPDIESKFLSPIRPFNLPQFGPFFCVEYSNESAKILKTEWFRGYNAKNRGKAIAHFTFRKFVENTSTYTQMHWYYVDSDVSISGGETQNHYGGRKLIVHFSLNLKKGWNEVYYTQTKILNDRGFTTEDKIEVTTDAVSGLKWTGN